MKFRILMLLAGTALAISGTATNAAQLTPPKVEYSANSSIETAEGAMAGKVYVAGERQRHEYEMGGQTTTMILRHDKQLVWMLLPEQKMYMEMEIAEHSRPDDLASYDMEFTPIGPETVNGVATTKNKLTMTDSDGDKLTGFCWMTPDDIIMRMEAISADADGKGRMKMELTNLEIGKQDPALFEIPPGYSGMNMQNLGGLGRMIMGGGADGGEPLPVGSQQPENPKGGLGLKGAFDLLR